jgi:hypothetical protein
VNNSPKFMQLVESLFKHGLSELPVLYTRANGTYLGYMVYEKGHLAFKDSGLFSSTAPNLTDWSKYTVGMVCYREMLQWKSLSFYGVDYCKLSSELNPDLEGSLTSVQNEFGDRLYDFVGSIYRAYNTLLSNNFLPVVLLRQALSKNNLTGLLIGDLRAAPLPPDVMSEVHDLIIQTLDIRLTIGLDELAA